MEAIVEKLCQKLKHNVSDNKEIEWRNTAYCLSQIKFNERNLNKLMDLYDSWKERIIDSEDVKSHFNLILDKCKKSNPNKEMKEKLDKFDAMINPDEEKQHLVKQLSSGKNRKSMNLPSSSKSQKSEPIQMQEIPRSERNSKKRNMMEF